MQFWIPFSFLFSLHRNHCYNIFTGWASSSNQSCSRLKSWSRSWEHHFSSSRLEPKKNEMKRYDHHRKIKRGWTKNIFEEKKRLQTFIFGLKNRLQTYKNMLCVNREKQVMFSTTVEEYGYGDSRFMWCSVLLNR